MCGSEVWTLSKNNEKTLAIWEREIREKIFCPVKKNGVWRIHTNQKLMNLYR
jgi:hypothetical protein